MQAHKAIDSKEAENKQENESSIPRSLSNAFKTLPDLQEDDININISQIKFTFIPTNDLSKIWPKNPNFSKEMSSQDHMSYAYRENLVEIAKKTESEPSSEVAQELALSRDETPDPNLEKPEVMSKGASLNRIVSLKKSKKSLLRTIVDMLVLLVIFLAHVIFISIASGFLAFFRYDSNFLEYLDQVFDGLFLGVITIALNLDLISKLYKDEQSLLKRKMVFSYIVVITCTIVLVIVLDRLDVQHNEYWIISIHIFSLIAATIIYLVYSVIANQFCFETKSSSMMDKIFLSIKKVFMTQLMIIYPFCQLFISVSYARIFNRITELNLSNWAIFGLCITYPISIGITKTLMEKTSQKTDLKMKFYIEYISIAFASLPFRTLFFDINEYDRLAVVLITKFFYKTFYYIFVALKKAQIKEFVQKIFERAQKKLGKRSTVILKKLEKQAIDSNSSIDSQVDIEVEDTDPMFVDFGMKFILLMFSDIFSTIAMIIIVSLFNSLKNGLFGSSEDVMLYAKYSSIDLGLDVLFLFIVTGIWRKSSSGLKNIDLFLVGKEFFKRYYLVFIAANFNLFHTINYILSSLLSLNQ